MSKPEFTPGPWRVVIDDDGNPLSGRPGVFASDELDCGIVHWDGFVQEYWRSARGDKEIHANARLIAAAPELYGALEKLLAAVNTDAVAVELIGAPASYKSIMAAITSALAALAKAKGENT